MMTRRLPLYAALILGILLAHPSPALPGGAPASPSGVSPKGAGEALVATVCSCDPEARTIQLLTGCGHALWMVKISVGTEAKLAQRGRDVQLAELKPGAIVRVRYHRSEDRNV